LAGAIANTYDFIKKCLPAHQHSHSHGDPHIATFDGHGYDLQAIGEFVYVDSADFSIQSRLQGEKGKATWNVATAIRAGTHVIESYQENVQTIVAVDGSEVEPGHEGINFPDGTLVFTVPNSLNDLVVVSPSGAYVLIESFGGRQNLRVGIPPGVAVTGGLGGFADGNTSNDFRLRDGAVLALRAAKSIEGLYGQFAQSWRVIPGERLFRRGSAAEFLTTAYTSLPQSVISLSDFPNAVLENARRECRSRGVPGAAIADCMFDVAATGDVSWANQAAESGTVKWLTGAVPPVSENPVGVIVPRHVQAGSVLSIESHGSPQSGDLVFVAAPTQAATVYPLQNRHDAVNASSGSLIAPAVPGAYEVRYFRLGQGTVMARIPLEVTSPVVLLAGPNSTPAGSMIQVNWDGPRAPGDLVFISSVESAGNRYPLENRHPTSNASPASLIAPAVPGPYEIRYFSFANAAVLARVPIVVTDANVSLTAPRSVAAGSAFRFTWQGPNATNDLIFVASPQSPGNQYPLENRMRRRAGRPPS
jgi:hypothetical protein